MSTLDQLSVPSFGGNRNIPQQLLDYDHGTHKTYEHYSMRLDVAAAERADELWARLKTPNAKVSGVPPQD